MTARRSLISLVVAFVLALAAASAAPVAAAGSCRFVLGFRTLHSLIPAVVGDCVDNEQHNPANGDAIQHTTHGLLVWRKHPPAGTRNSTAFTDGYRTWVNGPDGIQERLNSQRFAWEANPTGLPVIPATPQGTVGRCHSAELSISQESGTVAVGNVGVSFALRSTAAQPCTLYGFPGMQLLDAAAQPMPTTLRWSATGYLLGTVPEYTLTLSPGGAAYFVLEFTDVPGPGQRCVEASAVRVTPPNAFTSKVVPIHGVAPCGGQLTASPVLANDPFAANARPASTG